MYRGSPPLAMVPTHLLGFVNKNKKSCFGNPVMKTLLFSIFCVSGICFVFNSVDPDYISPPVVLISGYKYCN